jgi:hypothetical protein
MSTINIPIDEQEIWSALWGSGYETDPVNHNWLMSTEFLGEADWDKMGTAQVWFIPEGEDESDEKFWADDYQEHCAVVQVTIEDIKNAVAKAMTLKYYHVPCGGKIDYDTEEWDSCVADILLQIICYGKEVWA